MILSKKECFFKNKIIIFNKLKIIKNKKKKLLLYKFIHKIKASKKFKLLFAIENDEAREFCENKNLKGIKNA